MELSVSLPEFLRLQLFYSAFLQSGIQDLILFAEVQLFDLCFILCRYLSNKKSCSSRVPVNGLFDTRPRQEKRTENETFAEISSQPFHFTVQI
jgi:hypothetical protein